MAILGREAELAALDAALAESAPGAAPVLAVRGDAGIGKTSLVSQFAETSSARGETVLWGTCYEGSGPPYGAWTEALDRHLADLAREQSAELLAGDASVLAALLPSIRELAADLPPAPELPLGGIGETLNRPWTLGFSLG